MRRPKPFNLISHAQRTELLLKLRHYFPSVDAILPAVPFLLIECSEIPPIENQPFMVAGLVTAFIKTGDPYPFGIDFIGDTGGGHEPEDLPDSVRTDLKPFNIPSIVSFAYIYGLI